MSNFLLPAVLLGEGGYHHLGRKFRRGEAVLDSADFVLLFFALIAGAVAIALVTRYINMRNERGFSSPRALLSELCRAHKLSWSERRLIKRIAAHHGVLPIELFLEPSRFDPEQCGDALSRLSAEIAYLRHRLFDESGAPTESS